MLEIEHRDYRDTLKRCAELGGADLIVTSPPYLDSRARGQYGFDCPTWTMDDYEALGRAVLAGLKPGGVCALNIFGRVAKWRGKEFGTERSTHWMRVALVWQDIGLRYLECYAYEAWGPPGALGPRHRKGWEPIHIFARPGADPFFDAAAAGTVPAVTAGKRKTNCPSRAYSGWRRGGCAGETHHVRAAVRQQTTVFGPGNVAPGHADRGHPAPFTYHLADFFVLSYSAAGALVCDPFTGSGTVAISAAKHGRQFVGGDLGERLEDLERGRTRARWADVARERMLAAVPPAPAAQAA